MNKIEMLYKADTGNTSKIGFECSDYKGLVFNVDILLIDYFEVSDGIVELPTPEYVKWLEEKLESLQKFPGNNI